MNYHVFITVFVMIMALVAIGGGGIGAVVLFQGWLGAVLGVLWVALGMSALLAWVDTL